VGITLERRLEFRIVAGAVGANFVLSLLATALELTAALRSIVPVACFLAPARRWLPGPGTAVAPGATPAIPPWPIWSRNLMWVGVAILVIGAPFLMTALFVRR
jgi:hypothetical protein